MDDLNEAIRVARQAVKAALDDHPNLAVILDYLGHNLQSRYKHIGKMEDLQEAIRVARQAVKATPDDHPLLAVILNNLGTKLSSQYERTGKMNDLEEAIWVTRQAVKATPDDHPDLAGRLNNLGNNLERKYKRTGKMDDLEEAIRVARQAIRITPNDHPDQAAILNNLGINLSSQYERIGKMDDLEEAIQVTRQAIKATPDDYPDLTGWLNNLGNNLHSKYKRMGKMDDLKEAIRVARQAAKATPDDHPLLTVMLNNLGTKLSSQYERTGKMKDLEEAIRVARQAAKVTPDDHPLLAVILNNLGTKLGSQYKRTGKMNDLEEAIWVARQAVKATPGDHPNLAGRLNSLGNNLERKYKRTGKIDDLEEAIRVARQAVKVTPDDHRLLAVILNNLGTKLSSQYERISKMDDLEEAIQVTRQAVKTMPDDYPDLAGWLNNLGNNLQSRYERMGKMDDLEEAIWVARQAVRITPNDHPNQAAMLNNLGINLSSQYERIGKMDDLEEAIQVTRQAVKATPNDHPDLARWLNNLGNRIERKYKRTGKMDDLEEAIQVARQAVRITPNDHPDLARWLHNLARYLLSSRTSNNTEALEALLRACTCHNAIPSVRVRSSAAAVQLLQSLGNHEGAYKLSTEAIDLLPLIHNRSLSHRDQQHVVSDFSGLATSACSLALELGKPPEQALEILERGRGVILGLLIDDRSDTSELKAAYPGLCVKYENLRSEVNTPVKSTTDRRRRNMTLKRRAKAIKELNECIRYIQQLPGFRQFQKGLTVEQMQVSSMDGCIIFVNLTDLRGDAIIISPNGFKSLPLARFNANQAKRWINQNLTVFSLANIGQKQKGFRQFLSWLWQSCVKPILDELRYPIQQSAESLPRLWWIGTGLASSFPFHAASDHSAGVTESAYDRVISSYSPSIKSLIHARQRVHPTAASGNKHPKALIVTMPQTPDASDLPGSSKEKSVVTSELADSWHIIALDQPNVASVMEEIQQCNIAHLACHGLSDQTDPSESGLLLQTTATTAEQPRQDILRVRELCQAYLPQAEIAYLSACSTAENQAAKLVDETLHVVSGFQVAGFRHVIGCLWPSSDQVCVDVAKSFYSELGQYKRRGYSDRVIALALHKAVKRVRGRP